MADTPQISSVTPDTVASDGGYELVLTGVFEVGTAMRVYIGTTGTEEDAVCYSGKPGQGTTVYALTEAQLRCWTPRLPVGRPLRITVFEYVDPDYPDQSEAEDVVLRVRPADHKTSVFSLRQPWPKEYLVGPKTLENLPPVPEWE